MLMAACPTSVRATYNGNWVANVQEADAQGDGAITRHDGTSSMAADFVKDTVTVDLVWPCHAGTATFLRIDSQGDSQT